MPDSKQAALEFIAAMIDPSDVMDWTFKELCQLKNAGSALVQAKHLASGLCDEVDRWPPSGKRVRVSDESVCFLGVVTASPGVKVQGTGAKAMYGELARAMAFKDTELWLFFEAGLDEAEGRAVFERFLTKAGGP